MHNVITLKSTSTDISKLILEEEQTTFIVLFTISFVSTATFAFRKQTTFTSVLCFEIKAFRQQRMLFKT